MIDAEKEFKELYAHIRKLYRIVSKEKKKGERK